MADSRKNSNASDSSVASYNSQTPKEKEKNTKEVERRNLFGRVAEIARLPRDPMQKVDSQVALLKMHGKQGVTALGGKTRRRHKKTQKRKQHRKTSHRRK